MALARFDIFKRYFELHDAPLLFMTIVMLLDVQI